MIVKKLILGFYNVNCYIVSLGDAHENSCFIIDPGADFKAITEYIFDEKLEPEFILNTHGHYDHIGAVPELVDFYEIPFFLHKDDEFIATDPEKNMSSLLGSNTLSLRTYKLIDDNDIKNFSSLDIEVYEMPGHTPGGISIKTGNYLFTGDLLFRGGVGRTDLPGGNSGQISRSLKKIREFDSSLIVNPGHGATTTMENEIANNYYLSDDFLEGGADWF